MYNKSFSPYPSVIHDIQFDYLHSFYQVYSLHTYIKFIIIVNLYSFVSAFNIISIYLLDNATYIQDILSKRKKKILPIEDYCILHRFIAYVVEIIEYTLPESCVQNG